MLAIESRTFNKTAPPGGRVFAIVSHAVPKFCLNRL